MSESVTGRNMISDQKNGQVKRSNELERGTVVSETSKVVNSARRDAAGIYRPRSLLLFTSHSEFFSSNQIRRCGISREIACLRFELVVLRQIHFFFLLSSFPSLLSYVGLSLTIFSFFYLYPITFDYHPARISFISFHTQYPLLPSTYSFASHLPTVGNRPRSLSNPFPKLLKKTFPKKMPKSSKRLCKIWVPPSLWSSLLHLQISTNLPHISMAS